MLLFYSRTTQVEAIDLELKMHRTSHRGVREQLLIAQECVKKICGANWTNMSFEIGCFVCLILQPYLQASLSLRKNHGLSPRFHWLFEIIQKVIPVAYKLKLLEGSNIHPVFYVSLRRSGPLCSLR